jgi:hypothetical protein
MEQSGRHEVVLDLAIESLAKSGSLRFRVQGTSMLPTIRPGTYVDVRRTASDQIVTGDIILTKTPAGLRLHRVVEIRKESSGPTFITRGDNHRHIDRPAGAPQLLGRLNETLPLPGRLTRFIRRLRG